MSTQRKSIKLFPHERPLLVEAYRRRRIPIDQFEARPHELSALVEEWNRATGRTDTPADILHYMRTQRKRGLWVRFDGDYQPSLASPEMTAEQIEVLVSIYEDHITELSLGSDVLGYDPEAAELLAKEFSAEVGRIFSPSQCITKLTALRKRGLLPKAAEPPADEGEDHGFDDINLVG